MKVNMAESEYFSIGSIVSFQACFGKQFEGEVLAFDPQTKMLFLKSAASNGKTNVQDVHMINMAYVSHVDVKKEATNGPPPVLQHISLQKLTSRAKQQIDEKIRLINAMSADVSPEGQQLFLTITKTIEEVAWNGPNIVVMNQVTIAPPYRPENCQGKNDQALTHVRKIVEKFMKDQQVVVAEENPQAQAATNSVPQSSPQA